MKEKFKKTQNNDVFISPKWKNTILKMRLKSSIMSKLDCQVSEVWIEVANILLETTNKFGRLESVVPHISSQDKNLTETY